MPPMDERGCLLAEEAATAAVAAAASAVAPKRNQKIKITNYKSELLKNCFKKNTARFIPILLWFIFRRNLSKS